MKKTVFIAVLAFISFNIALHAQAAPQTAEEYVVRGIEYGESGDYDKAIADLNEAIRLDPQNANAYNAPRQGLCTPVYYFVEFYHWVKLQRNPV